MRKHRILIFLVMATMMSQVSCQKESFLDAKPSSNLVVPSSVTDFTQILENFEVMSETGSLGTLTSDEYYLTDDYLAALDQKEHNAYIWAKDLFQGQGNVADWNFPYQQVFYANVVLEGLPNIPVTSSNQADLHNLEGWALFVRAYAFYNLVQQFANPFDSTTATTDLGIPLKLSADINETKPRATLSATYQQIIGDLVRAETLLPESIALNNRNHPSRAAAAALLSRIYLSMRAYDLAGKYADSALAIYPTLIDYNSGSPFMRMNDETLYQSNTLYASTVLYAISYDPGISVDSNLYHLFTDPNDLRKTLFFGVNTSGAINLVNTYDGYGYCFTGLATDELYLIRAEVAARRGDPAAAVTDLNTLLVNRWQTGTYVPIASTTATDALSKVLMERRRELLFRGVRFSDLRRLNKEGADLTIMRSVGGQLISLAPNSLLYTMPIPPDELTLSGIVQNPR